MLKSSIQFLKLCSQYDVKVCFYNKMRLKINYVYKRTSTIHNLLCVLYNIDKMSIETLSRNYT